jgi:hypothetical protein
MIFDKADIVFEIDIIERFRRVKKNIFTAFIIFLRDCTSCFFNC